MLVLSRMIGEHIVIGDDIIVTVVRHRGNKMRIGITAPKNVEIHRNENLTPERVREVELNAQKERAS